MPAANHAWIRSTALTGLLSAVLIAGACGGSPEPPPPSPPPAPPAAPPATPKPAEPPPATPPPAPTPPPTTTPPSTTKPPSPPKPPAPVAEPQVPDVTVSYGENFDLHVGKTAALRDTPLTVRLERIVEDSRCPAGVNCVWAGEVVVRLQLRSGADTETVDLRSTEGPNREGSLQTFRIRLIRVTPAPKNNEKIEPDQYVVTFSIQRSRQLE